VIVGKFSRSRKMGNSIPVNILIFDSVVVVVFFLRSTLSKVKDQTNFSFSCCFWW